jgi:thiol:disulfide interchange protein DsbC
MKKILLFPLALLIFSCSEVKKDSSALIEEKLSKIIPIELSVNSIKKSEIQNFYEVELSDQSFFYIEENAEYLFLGDIYQIGQNKLINISQEKKFESSKEMIKKINPSSLITFSPKNIKYQVYVFTDVDCGFCRKFHNQISAYLDEGIEINYLAFPRAGIDSDTYNKMVTAWCSKDQHAVLTGLKKDQIFDEVKCKNNPIKDHYALAKSINIEGTPTIVSSTGLTIPGFIEAKELVEYLK